MRMKKILATSVLGLSMALAASSALADWNTSAHYSNLSDSEEGIDISVSALTVGIGYEFLLPNSQFSIAPELRYGIGIQDDIIDGVGVEVESTTMVILRANYLVSDSLTLFVQPSYTNLEIKFSYQGESFSDDSWEFGAGAGLGYKLSDTVKVEASYDNYDGSNLVSAGVRFYF